MKKVYFLLSLAMLFFGADAQDLASFSFAAGTQSNTVIFTNTSQLSGSAERRAWWSFGDGAKLQTAATAGAEHHYAVAGTYEVCLRIYKYSSTHDSTLSSQVCKQVVIQSVAACTANFEFRDSIVYSPFAHYLYFTAIASNSIGKRVLQVCWNFGDGTDTCISINAGATIPKIMHKYPATINTLATYNVCLTIKYDAGCEAKKCIEVKLQSPGTTATCSAGIRQEPVTANPLGRHLIAIPGHSLQRKPIEICWKFGDGSPDVCKTYAATYTGTYAVEHIYPRAGQYEACVKIRYDGGCEAYKCELITIVAAEECKADFSAETLSTNGLTRIFAARPSANNNRKPLRICWTFGDGKDTCISYAAVDSNYTIKHTYAHDGAYAVCVRIFYDGGCEAKLCKEIAVVAPKCEVSVYEVAGAADNLERQFYLGLMNSQLAEKICWSYGDGSPDNCYNFPNPLTQQSLITTHKYAAPGTYKVCIRVVYAGGCVAERCREVVIHPKSATTNTCGGYMTLQVDEKTVTFKGFGVLGSTDKVVSFNWTFGDGTSGSGAEVKHTYAGPGNYEACLLVKTEAGCETRICKRVIIAGNVQSQLVLSPNPVSSNLHVLFYSTKNETVSVRIFNANGVLLKTFTKQAVAGANNWDFPEAGTLQAGVYSVIVQSSLQFASGIFFKQ